MASFLPALVVAVTLCLQAGNPVTLTHDEYPRDMIWGAMMDLEADYDWIRNLREDLGLRSVRVSAHWDLTEPVVGKGYEWEVTHRNIESALNWGLEPVVLITGTPRWASGITEGDVDFLREKGLGHMAGIFEPREEFIDDYCRWLRNLVRHFEGDVLYYEYWNEPDGMGWPVMERGPTGHPMDIRWGGNATLYSKFLQATYETVKSVDPEAQVAVGGLESKTSFLVSLYEATNGDCFDAVCIHPYGGGEGMGHGPPGQALNYEWIAEIRQLMEAKGDGGKAVWITEYGWRTLPSDGDLFDKKIDYLREALQYFADTPWITITHLHYLSGDAEDPWDCSHPELRKAWRAVRWG